MIIDGLLVFDPQGTAITTSAASTNTIDLLNARDMGIGENLYVFVALGSAAFAGGTNLNVQVQYSVDNSTWFTAVESGVILTANLTANSRIIMSVPHRPPGMTGTFPRYIRLNYAVTGTFTAGSVYSFIILDAQAAPAYPAGINITN